jgi:hypothetical protein
MKRASAISLVALTALVASPVSASGATQIGETFTPDPSKICEGGFTHLQSEYAAPSEGVITSWSFQASTVPPQMKLKIAEPLGGTVYKTIAETGVVTTIANSLNTYPARIHVQAGDRIGLYQATNGQCARLEGGWSHLYYKADVLPGMQATYHSDEAYFDISAMLEPDADHDGYGDETQDQCPTYAATQGPCPSNLIRLGKPRLNKMKGTARLPVTVSGPGVLVLTGQGVTKQKKTPNAAGTVKMLVKPTLKTLRKLQRTGRAKVKITVAYTPTGGTPNSKAKAVVLRMGLG